MSGSSPSRKSGVRRAVQITLLPEMPTPTGIPSWKLLCRRPPPVVELSSVNGGLLLTDVQQLGVTASVRPSLPANSTFSEGMMATGLEDSSHHRHVNSRASHRSSGRRPRFHSISCRKAPASTRRDRHSPAMVELLFLHRPQPVRSQKWTSKACCTPCLGSSR